MRQGCTERGECPWDSGLSKGQRVPGKQSRGRRVLMGPEYAEGGAGRRRAGGGGSGVDISRVGSPRNSRRIGDIH